MVLLLKYKYNRGIKERLTIKYDNSDYETVTINSTQKESLEERFNNKFVVYITSEKRNTEDDRAIIFFEDIVKIRDFINQERLLAQKEFADRILAKKTEMCFEGYAYLEAPLHDAVLVEDIESEMRELGL